jgi:hypothetical protein
VSVLIGNAVAPQNSIIPTLGKVALPAMAVAGAKIAARVPVVLTNTGAAVKSDAVVVNLYADTGTSLDGNQMLVASQKKELSLRANQSVPVNFAIRSLPMALPDGTYHLLAEVVDASGTTTVATTQTITVAAAFVLPVVTVGNVTPSTIALGKLGSLLVTVANNGNVPAAGVDITLNPSADGQTPVSGVILETIRSGVRILPGKSRTFRLHFKVTSALAAGKYFPYVLVSLDGVSTTEVGTMEFTAE